MKIYAVREIWQHEVYDLVYFSMTREGAQKWIDEHPAPLYYDPCEIEEVEVYP